MRRRNPFGRQAQAPNAPPVIKMQAPVLDTAGLASAYEWMPVDKMSSFRLAFEWYAQSAATLLYGDPLDADRQRSYDRATKAKLLGDSSNIDGEKTQAYSTALHLFEKTWAKRPLPKLDAALQAAEPSRRVAQIQTVLGNLTSAYANAGVRFRMTFNAEREFGEGEIAIPESEINNLIPQPPLKSALAEALTVAKVKSLVTDEAGNTRLDGSALLANLPVILQGVADWAVALNGTALKAVGKPVVGPKTRVQRTPGAPAAQRAPRTKTGNGQLIHILDASKLNVGGKRGKALFILTRDMTVAEFRSALAAVTQTITQKDGSVKTETMLGYCAAALQTAVSVGAVEVV